MELDRIPTSKQHFQVIKYKNIATGVTFVSATSLSNLQALLTGVNIQGLVPVWHNAANNTL